MVLDVAAQQQEPQYCGAAHDELGVPELCRCKNQIVACPDSKGINNIVDLVIITLLAQMVELNF